MTSTLHSELLEIVMQRRPGIPRFTKTEPPCPADDSYAAAKDEFDAASEALERAQRRFNAASRRVKAVVDEASEPLRKLMEGR